MEAASASVNLAAAQAIFQSEWRGKSPNERSTISSFGSAFIPAMKNNHVSVAQFLMSVGVSFDEYYVRTAVELKSYSLLERLLIKGLDNNKLISRGDPPPLA